MKKRTSNLIILFIVLVSTVQSMAQSIQPDVVCMGTSKRYYVDATYGSSYIWKINDESPEASTTNSVDINWTTSGIYTLTVQEKTKDNCVGPVKSLQVTVMESPTLQLTSEIGTESQTICLGGAINKVTYRFDRGATGVTVRGLPDGVKSVVNGNTVTLSGIPTANGNYTITTVGGAPCAEVYLKGSIRVNQLSSTISGTTITCQNAASPVVTFTGIGGTAPYTFTYNINGGTNKTVTTTKGDTVSVSVPTQVSGTFTYNQVDVIDSRGCTNTQTGTATITLTVLATSSLELRTICSTELPYNWNAEPLTASGTYSKTFKNILGCDSVAVLKLTINRSSSSTSKVTTCPYALPYSWNGMSYNEAGSYTAHLRNLNGCDSLATLILNVRSPLISTTVDYVCSSLLPYYWNKKLYYKSGTYTAQFTNPSGCDSIATLILTVVTPSSSITHEVINSTQLPYVWNKLAFTESGTYTSPINFVNSVGCDSIARLILKVNLSTSANTTASVCASELPYVWNGSTYTTSGTYTKTMTNVYGDNVLVTLNLTVYSASNMSQAVHLFTGEKYIINGHEYDKAGVYTDILKTINGCDSIVVSDISFVNIPNTLTPNGDQLNDVFMKGNHVQIFNRNGILLYEGQDGWDGKYHNKYVSKDTYFYVLYFISEGRTKSKEGYIMVLP